MVGLGIPIAIFLIDWISDTHRQGCTDLQSLVKCVDHEDCDGYNTTVWYAVMQRCTC